MGEQMTQVTAWKCDVCGYIHHGSEPPETCPICGVGREMFSPLQVVAHPSPPPAVSAWRCTICDYIHQGDSPPEICPVCGAKKDLFEPVVDKAAPTAGGSGVERLVIVGAGIAGMTAAEQARGVSSEVKITLISKEAERPYYRLNLSRYLAGEVTEEKLWLQSETWFEQQKIELLQGEVVSIDRGAHQIKLHDGMIIPFDRLVLANGSHPFVPPIMGATREGVWSFRTLRDARALIEQASPGSRCFCVGGGLLGLETAGALLRRGAQVTILEGFDYLLPRQLSETAGVMLRQHLEALGMIVHCNVKVKSIVGDERVKGVVFTDKAGEEHEVAGDLVVLATGVRANSYLARQSELRVKNGVIVDDQMRSSDPDIFAAGDVAEHRGVVYGIWPASYAQGMVAGINAAGGQAEFPGLPPSNQLKVLDVDLFSVGKITPADASDQLLEDQQEGVYRRLVCRDGKLVGAILYGDTSLAAPIKEAIEAQTYLQELPEILKSLPQIAAICNAG